MTLLIDAGPIVALADLTDPLRDPILEILGSETGDLVIPAPTTAEIDYMFGRRFGDPARRAFLADLAASRFIVAGLEAEEHAMVVELESRYADLQLVLAGCALVVLADRYETDRVLSFDERHLRAVEPLQGGSFTILPADR